MTPLGATTSKTSGGTPRDPLESRCGALQVLPGGLPRILAANLVCGYGCADLCHGVFGADFPNGCANFGANFCRRRQTAESRIFKKTNQNSDPKFGHLSQPWGKVLKGGWAVVGTPGGLRLALGWEP